VLQPKSHKDLEPTAGFGLGGSGRDFRARVRQPALTLTGVVRTPDEDGYVLAPPASAALGLDAENYLRLPKRRRLVIDATFGL
jgi:hypothetical protein